MITAQSSNIHKKEAKTVKSDRSRNVYYFQQYFCFLYQDKLKENYCYKNSSPNSLLFGKRGILGELINKIKSEKYFKTVYKDFLISGMTRLD